MNRITSNPDIWSWAILTGLQRPSSRSSMWSGQPLRSLPTPDSLDTRRGVLIKEMGQTYLADPNADGDEARTLRPLQAAAITYRIAFGPRAGQRVLTLRGAMAREGMACELLCSSGPAGTHQPGEATQARVRHRHAALSELRCRGIQNHRRHPGAAGDREDPELPGVGSAAAAQGSGARGGAARRCLIRLRCRTPIVTLCRYPAAAGGAARCVGKPWPTSESTPRPGQPCEP